MNKTLISILFLWLLLLTGCGQQDLPDNPDEGKIFLKLMVPQHFNTRVVDEDNPADEQIINNISLFFVDPVSLDVTHKYIHTAFVLSGDYQLITLPVEPAELQTKHIYAIANYNDIASLEAISNSSNILTLTTPPVDKDNNLDPLTGFCMSGFILNFDFVSSGEEIATIPLTRACAKLRISLTFPENSTLSTDNSFLIQNAPNYTFALTNPRAISSTGYFNFAAPIALNMNDAQEYTNVAYIYESLRVPTITFYTHINGSTEAQEYTASLPLPTRNYLYDIVVTVYEDEATRSDSPDKKYRFESKVTAY